MTVMLYKPAGGNVGAKGESYVVSSGAQAIGGVDYDWVVVADDDVTKATKDGWAKTPKPAKKKKAK